MRAGSSLQSALSECPKLRVQSKRARFCEMTFWIRKLLAPFAGVKLCFHDFSAIG
jgi:hypothetical protein